MNSIIIYFSKFGNTQQLAESIADELAIAGPVRTIFSDDLSASDLKNADLVIMGTPTHNMNLPKNVQPILAQLPRSCLRGKQVAAFDTSYDMNWFLKLFTASKRLDSKLRRLGGKRVVRPEIFLVAGREGPLVEGELDRARLWARSILDYLVEKGAYRTAAKHA